MATTIPIPMVFKQKHTKFKQYKDYKTTLLVELFLLSKFSYFKLFKVENTSKSILKSIKSFDQYLVFYGDKPILNCLNCFLKTKIYQINAS